MKRRTVERAGGPAPVRHRAPRPVKGLPGRLLGVHVNLLVLACNTRTERARTPEPRVSTQSGCAQPLLRSAPARLCARRRRAAGARGAASRGRWTAAAAAPCRAPWTCAPAAGRVRAGGAERREAAEGAGRGRFAERTTPAQPGEAAKRGLRRQARPSGTARAAQQKREGEGWAVHERAQRCGATSPWQTPVRFAASLTRPSLEYACVFCCRLVAEKDDARFTLEPPGSEPSPSRLALDGELMSQCLRSQRQHSSQMQSLLPHPQFQLEAFVVTSSRKSRRSCRSSRPAAAN